MNTITDDYRALQTEMHSRREEYGAAGGQWAQLVVDVANSVGSKDVLDYGAGKQNLAKSVPSLNIKSFDPAIPEISDTPNPADVVVCTHVLPFVEASKLKAVMEDLKRVTKKTLVVAISTNESSKLMDNGESVTQTVLDYPSWIEYISKYFVLLSFNRVNNNDFISTWLPRS